MVYNFRKLPSRARRVAIKGQISRLEEEIKELERDLFQYKHELKYCP